MKHFTMLIILSLFVYGSGLQAQNLSESETVQYIKNTFDNYEVFITEGNIYFAVNDCDKKLIKYNNPILTIECSHYTTTIAVSFNVNDVYFETGKENGWDMLFIKGKANISYNEKLTSKVNLHWREQIVTTRLKNALEHLQKISGKGKSASDPFDDKPSTQNSISRIESQNVNNRTESQSTSRIESQGANIKAESQNTKIFTYRGSVGAFSFSYPSDWEIAKNPYEMVKASIVAPVRGNNSFRTNVNVVSSKKSDSLESIFQVEKDVISRNRQIFNNYQLISKEEVIINGIRGLKVAATWSNSGVKVKGIQYILKKIDNTTYTITFTIGQSSYEREVENIIQSFKAL